MSQQNTDLQFWLLNEQKRPLYVDEFGMVQTTTLGSIYKPNGFPAHLTFSPDGWREELVKYARNPKYLGMMRDFTVPLNFVKDGSKIIKDTLWRQGMDAILYVSIWKLNKESFPAKYEHWYTGELDLSKAEQDKDGVQVQVVEGGLSKDFKAAENTVYEIDIHNDAEKKFLRSDGLTFTNKVEWSIYDGQQVDGNNYWAGMGITYQEGYTQGILVQDEQFAFNGPDYLKNEWFNYGVTKNYIAKLRGNINIIVNTACTVAIRFKRIRPVTGGIVTDDFVITFSAETPGFKTYPVNHDIPMQPGDRLFMQFAGPNPGSSTIWWQTTKGSITTLEYDVRFEPTYIEGLSARRVCTLLLNKFSPGSTLISNFLDSIEDQVFLTSGPSLRLFGAPSVIKTSISDFFQSFRRYGIAIGIDGDKFIVEKYNYFFRATVTLDLGIVNDYEIKIAEELVSNTFKLGFPNDDKSKLNGRDEFNVTTNFTSPIKKIVKELDLSSVYHGGMYEIEEARIAFFGQDTTNSSVDNTVYMLWVKKGATYLYYSGDFTVNSVNIEIAETLPNLILGDTISIAATPSTYNGNYIIGGYSITPGSTVIGVGPSSFPLTSLTGTLSITSVSSYSLDRPAYDLITGLLHPDEAFNIPGRPKISMYNNGGLIRAIEDQHDAESMVFTSGDRNSLLSTTLAGVVVTENADEPIGGLAPQLFKPYFIRCKVAIKSTYSQTVKTNPYDLVKLTIKNQPITAYLWDGSMNDVTKAEQEFVLLVGPNNNTANFIDL